MPRFVFFILILGVLVESEPTVDRYMMFIRKLFFGPENLRYSNAVIFDQNQGEVNRESYKRAFGIQGQNLVEIFGKGLPKEQLQNLGYL